MPHYIGTLLFAVAASLLPLTPGPAHAQATAVAGGSPNHIDLAIPVTASVANRCSMTIGGDYTASDINAGFAHDFGIVLQCNVASRVAVASANGGLLAPVSAPPPGYTKLAPYRVTLNLVGDTGVTAANAVCEAATLTGSAASPCTFRGPATPTQGLKLNGASSGAAGSFMRVSAFAYAGPDTLIASTAYADTLTITLSVSI